MKRIVSLFLIILAAACAPVISKGLRSKAAHVPFEVVRRDPLRYMGQTFIWGGTIANVTHAVEGSYLEVVQNPLDSRDEVKETDVSHGRFLVLSKTFLDPLLYKRGRVVSVAGVLSGTRQGKIGGLNYLYPVLSAEEMHLFSERRTPAFVPSISIGVGGWF